jgi:hypothetical protein
LVQPNPFPIAVREKQSNLRCHLKELLAEVRKVFESLVSGREAASKLLDLCQNSRSAADYAVNFCTLATESAWNLESLFNTFLHGLSEVVKDELAARELPVDLDSLITLPLKLMDA